MNGLRAHVRMHSFGIKSAHPMRSGRLLPAGILIPSISNVSRSGTCCATLIDSYVDAPSAAVLEVSVDELLSNDVKVQELVHKKILQVRNHTRGARKHLRRTIRT